MKNGVTIIDPNNTIAIKGEVADAEGGEQIEIEKQEIDIIEYKFI